MPRWPLNKLVEVTWDDSCGYSKWDSIKNYKDHQVALCRTVGYLLNQNKRQLLLVFTQAKANDGDANGAMAIPMGCVRKIRRFDVKG